MSKEISEDLKKALNDLCKRATESGFMFYAAVEDDKVSFNSTNIETGKHGDYLLDLARRVYSQEKGEEI